MFRLFTIHFGHIQHHPVFQFLTNASFEKLLNAVCELKTLLLPELIEYYKLTCYQQCDYAHVCKIGFIPDPRLMNATTSHFAFTIASQYGHLDLIKWLHINGSFNCTSNAMNYASLHP